MYKFRWISLETSYFIAFHLQDIRTIAKTPSDLDIKIYRMSPTTNPGLPNNTSHSVSVRPTQRPSNAAQDDSDIMSIHSSDDSDSLYEPDLDLGLLKNDLQSDFYYLAKSLTRAFERPRGVFNRIHATNDEDEELFEALDQLHGRIEAITAGISTVYTHLANAKMGPKGDFNKKVNDHAFEINHWNSMIRARFDAQKATPSGGTS
ncbi:hypothetical protein SCAR479_05424 [Seiridium cardinale]|uniref:Uncharacterized protein n=1 Tax=Seiridium cardinale TaxID=138064 RepID=A0ABR2XVG5_9PEZI